jgi:hypothetical protein
MKNNNLQSQNPSDILDSLETVNESSTKKIPQRTYRKMFTQLSTADYLKIEQIAYEKNTTPYKIASAVLTLWLHGELVRRVSVTDQDA